MSSPGFLVSGRSWPSRYVLRIKTPNARTRQVNLNEILYQFSQSGFQPFVCIHKKKLHPSYDTFIMEVSRQYGRGCGKDYPVLQSGGRAWPPFLFYRHRPWQCNLALARVLAALTAQKRAPVSNSNSGAWYASVLSRPVTLAGVSVISESELAKAAGVDRCQCLRGCGHCGMVKEAVAHVWRFEGPWQTRHRHRDVISRYFPCVPPGRFRRDCYGRPLRPD